MDTLALSGYPLAAVLVLLAVSLTAALYLFLHREHLKHKSNSAVDAAIEEAKRSMSAQSTFLANVSHEIRTPMNAIIGLSHIVLKSELTPEQRRNVQNIKHATEMLLSITNDILDFSKIEAGKLTVEAVEVNTGHLFNQIADVITYSAVKKGIDIVFTIDDALPETIITDGLRLQQVILNLLSNAVKFTEKGCVRLNVTISGTVEENRLISVDVSDTGIGLSDKQRKNLFRSFSQADNSISRKYGGTGLGLVISRQLVDMMGGTLDFDSTYREGSRFFFSLPLIHDTQSDESNNKLLFRLLAHKQLLILDDSAASAKALVALLERYKPVIKVATSPSEFIKYLQWGNFDIAFIEAHHHFEKIRHVLPEHAPGKIVNLIYRSQELSADAALLGHKTITKPYLKFNVLSTIADLYSQNSYTAGAELVRFEDLQRIRGSHILLVEDNEGNQMVIEGLLEGSGIEIDIAANGQKGVEKLFAAPDKYALILMDINMPVMDGFSATSIIREYQKYDQIPIIGMTANITESDVEKCKTFGMQKHIGKPIDVDDFYATLLQFIPPTGKTPSPSAKAIPAAPSSPLPPPPLLLGEIEGIDTADGLRRVNGNQAVYINILRKFAQTYDNLIPILRRHTAQQSLKEGKELAHSLKGLAGNIGARAIYDLASDLERAFLDNSTDLALLIDTLDIKITPILHQLQTLTSPDTETTTKSAAPSLCDDELRGQLLLLADYAKKRKAHQVKQIAKILETRPHTPNKQQDIDTILAAVSQYRFELVADIIEKMYPAEAVGGKGK